MGLRGIAYLPGGAALPPGNRHARFTDGGRLPGLLQVVDGRFSFQTELGTEFDVPLAEVDAVRVPGVLRGQIGRPGTDLQCRVGGAKYHLVVTRLLWSDESGERILPHLPRLDRPGAKKVSKEFVKGMSEIMEGLGFGAGHLIGGAIDRGIDRALGEAEEEVRAKPEPPPPRAPPEMAPAPAFRDALGGKPVPIELTNPTS